MAAFSRKRNPPSFFYLLFFFIKVFDLAYLFLLNEFTSKLMYAGIQFFFCFALKQNKKFIINNSLLMNKRIMLVRSSKIIHYYLTK